MHEGIQNGRQPDPNRGPSHAPQSASGQQGAENAKGPVTLYQILIAMFVLMPAYPFLGATPVLLLLVLLLAFLCSWAWRGLRNARRGRNGQASLGRTHVGSVVLLLILMIASLAVSVPSMTQMTRGLTRWGITQDALPFIGQYVLNYRSSHEGNLPDPRRWCDILTREENLGEYSFGYGEASQSRYAINIHAYDVEGPLPDDLVLLFQSDWGWNQAGGPELASSANGLAGRVWVYHAGGTFRDIAEEYVPRLRWRLEDQETVALPNVGMDLLILSVVTGLALLAVVGACWTRNPGTLRLAAFVGVLSIAAAVGFGNLAEELYVWGRFRQGIFLKAGAPVGFAVGAAFVLLIAKLKARKAAGDIIFGQAAILGGLTGIASACLIHVYMMIVYDNHTITNMLAGQVFGFWAGVILGGVTSGLLGMLERRQQICTAVQSEATAAREAS